MVVLALAAAFGAALCSGVAAVLQARVVGRPAVASRLGVSFLVRLVRSGAYLGALALVGLGFLLSLLALRELPVFVVEVARATGRDVTEVAGVYFVLSERFRVDDLLSKISALPREDRWQTLARMALRYDLYAALAARRPRDLERGFTSVGPHADDLEIRLGARLARTYASQGQQRALVLGWKIAEIENLHAALGFLPLLLLDDVSSELDPERNAYLMGYLAQSGAQTFLTTTDAELVKRAAGPDTVWYRVRGGEVERIHVPG